ncbi:NUDIX hydrolase [Sporanaerobacter acetigenes]|uniref:ADP-ribose pyrophosphatase n=1 Tax=Sporanaerobacter acetigenes DSM 13106 TaxID=1123281 RepID=A0A1M5XNV1_9FIRM|nr:NUDIX hydrolase [Sporanaerobacter acetigenes]SHI01332.1 ADP-ribose pyrophosphatase [Sporanaerobacter acetigenes DSM 13106]
MDFEEKTMKTEKIYEGKMLNLRIDTVELPDKKYSKREIVEHPGAVAIVALTNQNEIVLVKQYRKAVERELLEIPAGKLEIGEEPKETAIRELKEETGYTSNKLEYLLEFYTSPGFSNEKIYLFLANELIEGQAEPEKDEYIELVKVKLEDLIDMIDKGEIIDSKTIIGAMVARDYLSNK